MSLGASLGWAADVTITLAALWGLVGAKPRWRSTALSPSQLVSAVGTCLVAHALGYSGGAATHTVFLAAMVSLAALSLARRPGSGLCAGLHLARALRVALAAPPPLPAAIVGGASMHAAAALLPLAVRHWNLVCAHIHSALCLDGLALFALHRSRPLTGQDLRDEACEEAFRESCRRIAFSPDERLFVLRGILRAEWRPLAALTTVTALSEVATHCRRIVFVWILAAVGGEHRAPTASVASVFLLWQLFALAAPAKAWISAAEKRISCRVHYVLQQKILELESASRRRLYSNREYSNTSETCGDGVASLARATGNVLSQMVNVWIVASRAGWVVVVPVIVVGAHELLSFYVASTVKRLERRKEEETAHLFWESYADLVCNLRAIRFYAWEDVFEGAVAEEDAPFVPPMVWRVASYVINVVGSATSQISSAVAIMSYIRSAATATYSEVALLMSSVDSLAAFTRTATGIARTFASLEEGGRYIRTLVAPDKDSHIRREATASPTPVLLEGCVFSWGAGKFTLPQISLSVAAGELVAVVGRVGSGKTSLMLALCGEMPLVGGGGRTCGRVGYVYQRPHVFSWTFRENVLMGEPYDEKLYRRVIHACALTHDLEHMDAGDATLIGEGGVKLSGGQKVRLALARALYRQADIYIFDDLLAAVDAHVERHLVEHVLSAEGIIGTKTRILVTHAMHVVPLSNRVVTLSNGRVEIATQTPAPLARVTNDAAKHGAIKPGIRPDSAAEAKRQPLVQLETGSEPVRWSHIQKPARLSRYWAVAAAVMVKLASFCAMFYADRLRFSLMGDSNPDTMVQSLQRYLAVNALVGVGRQQLASAEHWARVKIWSWPLRERLRRQFLSCVFHLPLQCVEDIDLGYLMLTFGPYRSCAANRLPRELCDTAASGALSALSTVVHVARTAPGVFWACVPLSALACLVQRRAVALERLLNSLADKSKMSHRRVEYTLLFYKELCRIHTLSDRLLATACTLAAPLVNHRSATGAVSGAQTLVSGVLNELARSAVLLLGLWRHAVLGQVVSPGEVDIAATLSLDLLTQATHLAGMDGQLGWLLSRASCFIENTERLARAVPPSGMARRPPEDWPSGGRIEFQNYSMRYQPDMELVLRDVSFVVGAGERVGVVGRTGAGKSSLTQAIMRMVEPAAGRVLIDGVDAATLDVRDLRSRISIIPQDPALFVGTIRDNLDPRHEYTDDQVWAAIRAAQIDHLLEKPSGVYVKQGDYELLDPSRGRWIEGTGLAKWVCWNGSNFSAGERQLISICRALLWQRRILILDEATANIDGATDRVIQAVLRREFAGCTVVTIAHRLDTVMDCDRILVMDRGRVAESGAPAALLARGGPFARLVESMRLSHGEST